MRRCAGSRRRTTSAPTSTPAARRKRSKIGETELRIAELIRPKLVADGMFLVGIDIVGDKILEVNVFSPGNLESCSALAGVDFSVPILEAIERKVAIAGAICAGVRQPASGDLVRDFDFALVR